MPSSNLSIGSSGGAGSSRADMQGLRARYQDEWERKFLAGGVSEIEEEGEEDDFTGKVIDMKDSDDRNGFAPPLESIREEGEGSAYSFDYYGGGDGVLYVVVGKQSEESTSMDALKWTLNNAVVANSTVVFLIHVFPETKFIPTLLGKLPVSQVNPEQKDIYMAQERGKRREFLQKFLNLCSASQVRVDTILIESDMVAKAILDLIPVLNIRKLVLGTTKSNARRMRSKKGGNGVADQILLNAPEFCNVKIICEGKEMSELAMESPSPSISPRSIDRRPSKSASQQHQHQYDHASGEPTAACGCFIYK